MLWFKHDAQTFFRGNVPLVVMEFGAAGYGLYQYVLERIISDVSAHDTSFKLHQPPEVVGYFLKLEPGLVREILDGLVKLNLFEKRDDEYYCPQLIDTLDRTMAKSPQLRELIDQAHAGRNARRDCDEGEDQQTEKHDTKRELPDTEKERGDEQRQTDAKTRETESVPQTFGNAPDPSGILPGSSGKAPDASLQEKKRKEFKTYCPAGPDGGPLKTSNNWRDGEPDIEPNPDVELELELTNEQHEFREALNREQARPPEVQLLDLFNRIASRQFKPTPTNLKFFRARLKDFTFAQCARVIEFKVEQWQGTTFDRYLRPETLFNATKFESYLHESERPAYDMDPDERGERRQTLEDLEWV